MSVANSRAGTPDIFAVVRQRLSALRFFHILLFVCVLIATWLVIVPLSALFLTAFTEDNIYGVGAPTFDNFISAYSSWDMLSGRT